MLHHWNNIWNEENQQTLGYTGKQNNSKINKIGSCHEILHKAVHRYISYYVLFLDRSNIQKQKYKLNIAKGILFMHGRRVLSREIIKYN